MGFLAYFEVDFLAEGFPTSFGSGNVAEETELRVQSRRTGEETGWEMMVLNRRLGPHLASLLDVYGMVWVGWTCQTHHWYYPQAA